MAFGKQSPWGGTAFSGPGSAYFGGSTSDYYVKQGRRAGREAIDLSNPSPTAAATAVAQNSITAPYDPRAGLYAQVQKEQQMMGPVAVADPYGNTSPVAADGSYGRPDYNPPTLAAGPNIPSINLEEPGERAKAYEQQKGWFFDQPTGLRQWVDSHAAQFDQPTANEQLYAETRAQGPQVNNALKEYRDFGGRRPNIASEPGYGSYYDRAETKLRSAMADQLGAIGAYGSSAGLGLVGDKVTDLRADQARTEADYNLSRLGEQRQWDDLGGRLARNADLSGQGILSSMGGLASAASGDKLDRLKSGSDVQAAADSGELARKAGGFIAAGASDADKLQRAEQIFNSTYQAYGGLQGLLGDAYDKVMNGDMQLMDAYEAAKLAGLRENANWESSQQGQLWNQIIQLITAAGGGTQAKT